MQYVGFFFLIIFYFFKLSFLSDEFSLNSFRSPSLSRDSSLSLDTCLERARQRGNLFSVSDTLRYEHFGILPFF